MFKAFVVFPLVVATWVVAAQSAATLRLRVAPRGVVSGPTADSDLARKMLEEHTNARAAIGANKMMHVTWDQELADLAAFHVSSCDYGHGNFTLPDGRILGQNIGAFKWSPTLGEFPAEKHVENWMLEKKYYDLEAAHCDDMALCGHISQVLWSRTSKIGCASKYCDNEQEDYMVCNYRPFGNELGQAAYQVDGAPCSQCNLKGGTACVSNQCVDCQENSELAGDAECRSYDESKCVDKVDYCDDVLEDFCNSDMWETFARENCVKFCNFC